MGAIPANQENARLLEVTRGGAPADFDREATDGDSVWHGSAPAYYREQRRRSFEPGGGVIITRSLILDSRDPADIEFQNDDVVRFRFKGAEDTGKVQEVEEKEIPVIPGVVRLILEER